MHHKLRKYTAVQYLQAVLIVTPFILLGGMALEYYLAHRPLTGSEIEAMQAGSLDKEYPIDQQIKALKEIRKKFKPWVVQHRWMLTDVQNSKDVRPAVKLIWNSIPENAGYPVNESFNPKVDFYSHHTEFHFIPYRLYGFAYTWTGIFTTPLYKLVNGNLVPIPGGGRTGNTFKEWIHTAEKDHDFIIAAIYCPGRYSSQLWLSGKITERVENEVPIPVIIGKRIVQGQRLQQSNYQQVYSGYTFTD